MEIWTAKFRELECFVRKNNKFPPSSLNDIGVWAYHKKKRYLSGHLEPEKRTLLESLPGWEKWVSNSSNNNKWEKMYSLVAAYVDKYDMLPTIKYHSSKDGTLRGKMRCWVYNNQDIKDKYIDAIYSHDQKKANELLYKYEKLIKIKKWYFTSQSKIVDYDIRFCILTNLSNLKADDDIRKILNKDELEWYDKQLIAIRANVATHNEIQAIQSLQDMIKHVIRSNNKN